MWISRSKILNDVTRVCRINYHIEDRSTFTFTLTFTFTFNFTFTFTFTFTVSERKLDILDQNEKNIRKTSKGELFLELDKPALECTCDFKNAIEQVLGATDP